MSRPTMKLATLAATLALVAWTSFMSTAADDDEGQEDRITALMNAAHRGEDDENSPLVELKTAISEEEVDWDAIRANLPPFVELAAFLEEYRPELRLSGNADRYTRGVRDYGRGVQLLAEALETESDDQAREAIADEMADVLLLLVSLGEATGVDLLSAAFRKLALNAEKYPVEKARGRAEKYDQL